MKQCSVSNCNDKYFSSGVCSKHYYERYRRKLGIKPKQPARMDPNKRDPEYISYYAMRTRCLNKVNPEYPNYGGRGITIAEEWLGKNGYENFLKDLGKRPKNTTLDRINVNGNYEPGNVRWATWHQQAANRRNSHKIIGVRYISGLLKPWHARLMVNRVIVLDAAFYTKPEAIAARKEAEIYYKIV